MTENLPAYSAPWWARIPHVSTLFTHAFGPWNRASLRRERITAPDGGVLVCDYLDGNTDAGILVILPGLEGHSRTPSIQRILNAVKKRGACALVLHARACSNEPNLTKVSYHSNFTTDISTLVRHLHDTHHETPIKLLGFSLGANQIANYLGRHPKTETQYVHSALLCSPPLYLPDSAKTLDQALKGFYAKRLLKSMKKKVIAHALRFPELKEAAINATHAKTIRAFDAAWTAPVHGFNSVDHYYDFSSAHHHLSTINIPTTCLIAHDDPISPPCMEVIHAAKNNAALTMLITKHGGHIAFPHRSQKNWLAEWVVQEFF